MIWIGHNNLDWTEGLSAGDREHPGKALGRNSCEVSRILHRTAPISDRSRKGANHKVAIVVFGLANIDAFFKARKKAEAVHARNPALYPYFESGYRSFESLKPPYQKNMVRLSLMMNAEMRAMVGDLIAG